VKAGDTLYRAEVEDGYHDSLEVVVHEAVVLKVMPQTVRFEGSVATGYVRVMAIEVAETLFAPTRVEALRRAEEKINQKVVFWHGEIVKLRGHAALVHQAIEREP